MRYFLDHKNSLNRFVFEAGYEKGSTQFQDKALNKLLHPNEFKW
jgi:hypothetical protein